MRYKSHIRQETSNTFRTIRKTLHLQALAHLRSYCYRSPPKERWSVWVLFVGCLKKKNLMFFVFVDECVFLCDLVTGSDDPALRMMMVKYYYYFFFFVSIHEEERKRRKKEKNILLLFGEPLIWRFG